MTLVASVLPNSRVAVAAIGVAYNVYGILFIAFVAFSMAACAQVGGAGGRRQRVWLRLFSLSRPYLGSPCVDSSS